MKIIVSDNGKGGLILTAPASPAATELILASDLAAFVFPRSELPGDSRFIDAWERDGQRIVVNVAKAKTIAHAIRRADRAEQMLPLDIESTIPFLAEAAEAKRQVLRDRFDAMQVAINAASTGAEITLALS